MALDDAEASYTAMDLDRFATAVATASTDADCLADRPARSTIAHLHRVAGLHAYFAGQDPDRAAKAFAAARAIEPAYVFPESLVPAGHPVAATYVVLDPRMVKTQDVPATATGRMEIDGRATKSRPVDRPALVQIVTDDGAVAKSGYVWPDEALPDYAVTVARTTAAKGEAGPRWARPRTCLQNRSAMPKTSTNRTDIFALGSILYELTCARKPFDGEDTWAVFNARSQRAPTLPLRGSCVGCRTVSPMPSKAASSWIATSGSAICRVAADPRGGVRCAAARDG